MALEQLRNDVTNHVSQLPRCEDDYYICVFQNCSDPLRRDEADLDAYFQHLEQHSQNKHKLLQNMISTFNDTRITVAQKRAQYTPTANGVANNNNSNNNNNKNKKLKKPNNNKLNKNKQQPPAKKARQSKAATSAAATTATEAQTQDASTPASDEQLVDKANAAARPKKRQKKTDVIDHGFDDLVAGIKEGEKIHMTCPIEGCPKVISGFLYHLNSHLSAHRRAARNGKELRVRQPQNNKKVNAGRVSTRSSRSSSPTPSESEGRRRGSKRGRHASPTRASSARTSPTRGSRATSEDDAAQSAPPPIVATDDNVNNGDTDAATATTTTTTTAATTNTVDNDNDDNGDDVADGVDTATDDVVDEKEEKQQE